MKLLTAFLADVARTDAMGNVNALNISGVMSADIFPAEIAACSLVVLVDLEGSNPIEPHTLGLTLSNELPDGSTADPILSAETTMNADATNVDNRPMVGQLIIRLENLRIDAPGLYVWGISVNATHLGQIRTRVVEKKKGLNQRRKMTHPNALGRRNHTKGSPL